MSEITGEQKRHYDEIATTILSGYPELETGEDMRPRREIVAFLIDHGAIDGATALEAGFDVDKVRGISETDNALKGGIIRLQHGI